MQGENKAPAQKQNKTELYEKFKQVERAERYIQKLPRFTFELTSHR